MTTSTDFTIGQTVRWCGELAQDWYRGRAADGVASARGGVTSAGHAPRVLNYREHQAAARDALRAAVIREVLYCGGGTLATTMIICRADRLLCRALPYACSRPGLMRLLVLELRDAQ